MLHMGQILGVPAFHPEHDSFNPFPVNAFAIHHPEGVILVDTGIGFGNAFIDSAYPREPVAVIDELHRLHIDERDVILIVNTHLHFDHCGQNGAFACPIAVQRAEHEAAQKPFYTVDAWATIPANRSIILDGDAQLFDGIDVMLTPGHTPGHQAVIIRSAAATNVIAGQCVFTAAGWNHGVENSNLHAAAFAEEAQQSVDRLRQLHPDRVYFSHDLPMTGA